MPESSFSLHWSEGAEVVSVTTGFTVTPESGVMGVFVGGRGGQGTPATNIQITFIFF